MSLMVEKNHLDRTVEVSRLFDFYAELLSNKQCEVLNYYYNEDLTLSEIAAILKVSRQAVHEQIRHGTQALLDFERKLGLIERFNALNAAVRKLEGAINMPNADINVALTDIKALI